VETIQDPERHDMSTSASIARIDSLNDRAWALRNSDLERALQLAEDACRLAGQIDYPRGSGYGLRTIGWCKVQHSEHNAALSVSERALHIFEEIEDDVGAASALNTIGNVAMFTGRFDDALVAHRRALRLREEIGDVAEQAGSLNNIGLVHWRLGALDEALRSCLRARDLYAESNDTVGYHSALNNLGLIYQELGEYPLSMECYRKILAGLEDEDQGTIRAMMYIGIATIYRLMDEHTAALTFLKDALRLNQEVGHVHGQAVALHNLGIAHNQLGNESQADECYRQALDLHVRIGNRQEEALILNNLGYVQENRGNSETAGKCFERALEISREIGSRPNEVRALFNIGNLLTRRGNPGDALPYLLEGHRLAEETGAGQDIADAHELLHACYKAMGEFEQALEHHERYHEQTSRLFNEESDRRLRNMQALHQVEQSRREAEIYRLRSVELAGMNASLERATRLKSDLLSVAAHDLGSPLSGIQRFADDLLRESRLPSSSTDGIRSIRAAAVEMQAIIHNLLVMAAIEDGELIVERRSLDLARIVRGVVERYRPIAAEKGQRLEIDRDGECEVVGDAIRLREVVDNLLSNAVKYSPRNTMIRLRLSVSGTSAVLAVEDQGPGLTPDDRERLFGRFQRLSARPTGGESSTGLGLWIVRQLVELHGGSVRVESEPGHGSRFLVELRSSEPETGKVGVETI